MKHIGLDIETIGLKPFNGTIWMLGIQDGAKSHIFHNCNGMRRSDVPAWAIKMLEDPNVCKIIHSGGFDIPYVELVLNIKIRNVEDTRAYETVIQGTNVSRSTKDEKIKARYSASLKYTLTRYGFPVPDKEITKQFIDRPLGVPITKEEVKYLIGDIKYLIPLRKAQEYILKRDGLWELALLESKTVEGIARMRVRGIGFNSELWAAIAARNQKEFDKRMRRLPKEVSNWNSEKQVKKYFRDNGICNIETYDQLEELYESTKNKVLGDFINARELHKTVTSYGMNWFTEGFVDGDGRVRSDFEPIVDTGRMSSNSPNLQNLPTLKKIPVYGDHRRAFIPARGHVFVIGDFTGQELGVMAAGANERIWIEAMLRGDDIHSVVASLLYAQDWEAATKRKCKFPQKCDCPQHLILREQAKTLNFMLAYGGGPGKFSAKTGVSMFDAKVIISKYKRIIPKLTKWLERNGQDAVNNGESYSASPYRRRRVIIGGEEWRLRNQGKNSPIQGAGADMLKLAFVSLMEAPYAVVLLVHDEIILEVPKAQAAKASKVLKSLMEQAADYITGIKGLIKVTPRTADNLLGK